MEKYGNGRTRRRPQPTMMPGEQWRLSTATIPSILHIDTKVYEHIHYGKCMEYWTRKGRLKAKMGEKVQWQQYKGALRLLPHARRQWTQKHFSGFEGTNSMMHKWQQRTTSTCPNCAEKETHRHVSQCQSDRATKAYRNIQRNFESWLKDTTSRDIRVTVMAHLDAYREQEWVEAPEDIEDDVGVVSRHQQTLGPNAFAEGFLVAGWENLQRAHLTQTQSKRCPSRWTRELIKKLWTVSWDMWDSRNQEVHKNQQTRTDIIIAQLDADIQRVHTAGTTNSFMPRLERMFFSITVDDVLGKTEHQKRTWLHSAKRYIQRDRQRVARNKGTRLMREWLQPGSTGTIAATRRQIINRADMDMRAPEGTRRGPLGRRR